MKNRSVLNRIFVAVFVLLLLVPSAGIALFGLAPPAANEILSPWPHFADASGSFNTGVLSEFSDWFSDHFALRQHMATAWAKLLSSCFHTSAEDKVLLGKGNWLFFTDTVNDYTGAGPDDAVIASAAENLADIAHFCEDNDIDFVFTVAPDKNSIYPEYMPDKYPRGAHPPAERLYARLEELSVPYADLHSAFTGESDVLYFAYDSHWTGRGAALAADEILKCLGMTPNYYSQAFTSGEAHRGDLYEMLYPAGRKTETDEVLSSGFSFKCEGDPNGGNALNIKTQCSGQNGCLMCWRDSFGISLYPYMAESFGKASFSRSSVYDLQKAVDSGCTAVVIEIVERNISALAENKPVIPNKT